MRAGASALLFLLGLPALALSGCFADDPPDVVVVEVSGRIVESGPAYGADQPDTCGASARSYELGSDPPSLDYVGSRPSVAAMRDPLVLVGTHVLDRMHVGTCGDPRGPEGARWADGSQVVAVHVEGYTESRGLTVRGGVLRVDGEALPEGESVRIPFVWVVELRPTDSDPRNGTYEYRGEVLVRHVATMPSHRVRAVADCGGLPSGC